MSKAILDCQPFNTSTIGHNWLFSSLRDWLNEDFYKKAFSQNERSCIYAGSSDIKEYRYIKPSLIDDPLFILSSTSLEPIYGIEYNTISDLDWTRKELQSEGTMYVKIHYQDNRNRWWLATGSKEMALLIEANGSLGCVKDSL